MFLNIMIGTFISDPTVVRIVEVLVVYLFVYWVLIVKFSEPLHLLSEPLTVVGKFA